MEAAVSTNDPTKIAGFDPKNVRKKSMPSHAPLACLDAWMKTPRTYL